MHVRDVLSRAGGPTFLAGLALILTALGPAREARAQQSEAVGGLDAALLPPPQPADPKAGGKAPDEGKKKPEAPANDASQPTTLSDIMQALLQYRSGLFDVSPKDAEARKDLLRRFREAVKKDIDAGNASGDAALREAVATLLGEFVASARGGFSAGGGSSQLVIEALPPVADTLASLGKTDGSPEVRAGAARALAKLPSAADPSIRALEDVINDPEADTDKDKGALRKAAIPPRDELQRAVKAAAGALEAILKDKDVGVRRAAAGALSAALRGTPAADQGTAVVAPGEPSYYNLAEVGPAIARAAGAALAGGERDAEVRGHCAEALLQVAQTLNGHLRGADTRSRKTLEPVVTALWQQTGALSAAARDASPGVRYPALRALELMGEARRRYLHPEEFRDETPGLRGKPAPLITSAPATPDDVSGTGLVYVAQKAKADPAPQEPRSLAAAVPALVRDLGDDDVRTRLAAIDALEWITAHGADRTAAQELDKGPAAQAAKALTRSLYDRDRFVRWAAARTLGKMAPLDDVEDGKQVEQGAVAGLARLMSEADPDVRLRVAYALERFGKAAGDAVPALAVAAGRGDDEVRIAAAHAIQVIGANPGAAVPALAAGLDSNNTRLRRAVAEAIGKYGDQARAAKPALQRALRDPDPEVRRLASDALIKIGAGK